MSQKTAVSVAIVSFLIGCAGVIGIREIDNPKEHDLRAGNIPSSLHLEWKDADRCTKCHMTWSWEYGYYQPWARYGLISDYYTASPYGYKDPYGLDAPRTSLIDYYYSGWWWNPDWIKDSAKPNPKMNLTGYGRINDGTAKPEDFEGTVLVVDQSGKGDARTIQEAVDKAASGTTIYVRSGKYRESVRLKEGIRLWGENVHTTVIDPDLTGSAIIAANNCDVSGFTLTGTGMNYKTYEFSSGVHALDCDSTLVIRGNFFDSNAVFGILVESSRVGGTPKEQEKRYIHQGASLKDIEYTGYPNPRIIGNTFYVIGERAVYCIHSAPEVANNVFIGNVKTVGMTQKSKPFIHHNVFYRNNVPFNVNRSMPVIAYNIMLLNYWGQRVVEGGFPIIHDNITWKSPYYKEFAENGKHIPYKPYPGTGELEMDPCFVDPNGGDFRIYDDSSLSALISKGKTYGLVTGPDIQSPPVIPCKRSYAEEFINRSEKNESVLGSIENDLAKVTSLSVSYSIDYKSYMDVVYDSDGDQKQVTITHNPVSGVRYTVPVFTLADGSRRKTYVSELFSASKTVSDSGTVLCEDGKLSVLSGRFYDQVMSRRGYDDAHGDDPFNIGEQPVRENYGGLYLDYDQYFNGAIGPGGTFYYGYLRILGGAFAEKTEVVDGHECVVVAYPHIGTDQVYKFYLDPSLNYRPRKLEHYFERELYRKIDNYSYETVNGVVVPMAVTITDYAVKKPHIGKVVGVLEMRVGEIKVNKEE